MGQNRQTETRIARGIRYRCTGYGEVFGYPYDFCPVCKSQCVPVGRGVTSAHPSCRKIPLVSQRVKGKKLSRSEQDFWEDYKIARRGRAWAQCSVGERYAKGDGVSADDRRDSRG